MENFKDIKLTEAFGIDVFTISIFKNVKSFFRNERRYGNENDEYYREDLFYKKGFYHKHSFYTTDVKEMQIKGTDDPQQIDDLHLSQTLVMLNNAPFTKATDTKTDVIIGELPKRIVMINDSHCCFI